MIANDVKWTDVVQAPVGLCGLALVLYQLRELQRSIQGQTISDLYEQYHQVVGAVLERPTLRPYFYENKALDSSISPALQADVESTCELIAAVLEHAHFQGKDVGTTRSKQCWGPTLRSDWRKAPSLRITSAGTSTGTVRSCSATSRTPASIQPPEIRRADNYCKSSPGSGMPM